MEMDKKSKLALFAPAKLNLGLRVLRRRPDGYHELRSLMVPISLGDTLEIEKVQSGFILQSDHPGVPTTPGSLLEKAFQLAAARLNYAGGLSIRLHKETPIGAGMGGGSSDAACVIKAVEQFSGRKFDSQHYAEVAFHVGADVPFFLMEKPCWMEGIGEKLTPVEELPPLSFIVIYPRVSISTKWVYTELKSPLLTGEKTLAKKPASFSSVGDLLPYLANDLESVVLPQYAVVREMKQKLLSLGGDAALMSGSGSALFGLFSDSDKRKKALLKLQGEHPGWWIRTAEVMPGRTP